ncbi:MAG: periplasmic heavy metal sensor [Pyrinomonadaceae bacterium]
MKTATGKQSVPLSLLALSLLLFVFSQTPARAQNANAPDAVDEGQATNVQGDQIRKQIGDLDLSPDQIEKIRTIYNENKVERQRVNQRLRRAQRSLDEAIDSDNPNETEVNARAREFAEAQAAARQMRALTEIRIRRVLTPEQLNKLRNMRREAMVNRRMKRIEGGSNGLRPGGGLNRPQGAQQPRVNNNPRALTPRERRLIRKGRLP